MHDGEWKAGLWAVTEGTPWLWPSLVAGMLGMAALAIWAVRRMLWDMRDGGVALVHAAGDSGARLAERLAAIVREQFHVQPMVRVDGRVTSEGTYAARELVTRKQVLTCRREMSHQWLGSTKQIAMEARFTVKAGFDLGRPIRIEVGPDGKQAAVAWPEARIVSVEVEEFVPAAETSGWWNRITPEDRVAMQSELKRLAAEEARAKGLLQEAEAELRQLLVGRLGEDAARLALTFGDEADALPGTGTGTGHGEAAGGGMTGT